ncbi:hypothetical protein APUTEX25_002954 [Auxenochlorella protothecoides]|uniref:Alcohol dehydrogenase n=1 Tax=Auxenochlorella protothecoides TaxID=3075 RepID=A0A3M7L4B4_AUXPR|nr:hypothetical protein APUTEX25_002954 [Auxenochlorella protothecoides]|eukprot:RMZ56865.1 hypothetical protein APUTEX25_002954 [Auxenochlorella protothecoides]
MDALVLQSPYHIEVQRCPVPRIAAGTDAIVRVELAGLCGSDLHPFRGKEATDGGTIMGHEFVGTVVEVGPAVTTLTPGTRVMSPFTTSCGVCAPCASGLTCRCDAGQLFGWRLNGQGLHGAQAQFIRVPLAASTLVRIPPGVGDEAALLAGDILSTGYFCARNAGLARAAPGVVVAVVGCGPVGLLAATAAGRFPAVRAVLAIDSVPGRLALAGRLGATPVNSAECDPIVAVREATGGQGADVVLEVVGAGPALGLALDLLKPGGVVSSAGPALALHADPGFPFTPADLYNKNATLASGRCPARSCLEELLPALAKGELGESTAIITHRLPLLDGVRAYEAFEQRLEGWVKVVFDPWTGGKPASESV